MGLKDKNDKVSIADKIVEAFKSKFGAKTREEKLDCVEQSDLSFVDSDESELEDEVIEAVQMNKSYFTKEEMDYIYADISDSNQDVYAEIDAPTERIYVYMDTLSGESYHFDMKLNLENQFGLNNIIINLRRQRVQTQRLLNLENAQVEDCDESNI